MAFVDASVAVLVFSLTLLPLAGWRAIQAIERRRERY
jgi:hypothetical protein